MRIPCRAGIRLLLAVSAGLLPFLGCGSSAPLYQSSTPAMEAFVSTEIPLRFDRGYPTLFFHASADSVEVFLDTGAAQVGVGLSTETVRSLGLQSTGRTRTLKTNYGRVRTRRAIVPEARLGGITFSKLACDRVDAEAHPSFDDRGILGLALLRQFNVLFDYRGSRLVLSRPGHFPADFDSASWKRIPFADHPDGMMISGRPEGISKDLNWCLDTGAIALDPEGKEYYNLMKPKHFSGMAGTLERDNRVFAKLHAFQSGGIEFGPLNFLGLDFSEPGGVDGFLGADFFMKNRVWIDFANDVLWIKSSTK
jgi:hypothetical protein